MADKRKYRLGKEEAHVNGHGEGAYLWLGRGNDKDGWPQIVAFGPGPATLRKLARAILAAVPEPRKAKRRRPTQALQISPWRDENERRK